eukprot:619665-Amphidinium_carterae.1
MHDSLVKALKAGKLTDCRDRAMLVLDAFALAQAGKMRFDDMFRLIAAYVDEEHYVVLLAISQVLFETSKLLGGGASPEVVDAFSAFAEKLVQKTWMKVNPGFEAKAGDGHVAGLRRGLMMKLMSKYAASPEFIAQSTERFEKYLEDPQANAGALPD